MTLLETWREKAYGEALDAKARERLWTDYFEVEKGIYEKLLKDPKKTYEGTIGELAKTFKTDVQTMTGFLDGINESLKGYENPIDDMDEKTALKIEIDPEKLYYNMVGAKAEWLYELKEWDKILTPERREELFKECKSANTVKREGAKIYPNDPCPCGSGKKYKKCCGKP